MRRWTKVLKFSDQNMICLFKVNVYLHYRILFLSHNRPQISHEPENSLKISVRSLNKELKDFKIKQYNIKLPYLAKFFNMGYALSE